MTQKTKHDCTEQLHLDIRDARARLIREREKLINLAERAEELSLWMAGQDVGFACGSLHTAIDAIDFWA